MMSKLTAGILRTLIPLAFIWPAASQTSDTIRMMQYNLMYYTSNSGVSDCNSITNSLEVKDQHIKTIFRHVKPTVMCVCEMGSHNQYADRLLNNAINTDGIDYYRRGPLTNQSGGNIANMIYYDSRKLTLHQSTNITTAYRDINGYTFYYNAENLSSGDTIFMTFWIAHLKAGTSENNEAARLSQVQKLMNRISNSGVPGNYTFSGDFNIYHSEEPAYQELTEYPNSLYRFYDPANAPGYWHSNPQFASLHTQSTHSQSDDCFSSGGLDDRFDMILVSPYLYFGSDRMHIIEDSYQVVGQDGQRYNNSILAPANNSVPSDVANALYHQSDHLPVVMDMTIDAHVGIADNTPGFFASIANPVHNELRITLHDNESETITLDLFSADGRHLAHFSERPSPTSTVLSYPFPYKKGLYILHLQNEKGYKTAKKILSL